MVKKKLFKSNSLGFTIVELLIATSVFSIVLLITTYGIVQITRSYIRGSVTAEVDNTNRTIISQISQELQLGNNNNNAVTPSTGPYSWNGYPTYVFCANGYRYLYQYEVPLPSALTQDNAGGGSCPPPSGLGAVVPGPSTNAQSLLSANMQILIPVNEPGGGTNMVYQLNHSTTQNLYGISLDILYGNKGSYNPTTFVCNNLNKGGAFCDNSTITTAVDERQHSDF